MYSKKDLIMTMATAATLCLSSAATFAEDWAISAQGSCKTSLGNTTQTGGGLRASGGTAVVTCPLTKEVGTNTINNIYVRLKRVSATGADPFCNVSNKSNYGTPSSFPYTFASDTTANQSMNLNLGTQYYAGYADVICVLNSGDTLYGIRYRQDN